MARTVGSLRALAPDVMLQLKSLFKDGTTPIIMAPLEFMQRLAALVPRPRLHLIPFDTLRTNIEDPPVIVKILSHLGLPTSAPPRRFDLFQTI